MDGATIDLEAKALAREIASAVERLLDASEAALRLTTEPDARGYLETILETCTIGDLANQRLARIGRLARGEPAAESNLLQGPADGLDQATADALKAFD